ncbi:hypothetical protein [Nonomuraea sp. NPDC050691]|uniref:hypothetical protein n=1 Tax=Nonomuraea sp. NPDC050691 TaxID=3155661 RepID=UPI00340D4DBF
MVVGFVGPGGVGFGAEFGVDLLDADAALVEGFLEVFVLEGVGEADFAGGFEVGAEQDGVDA